MTDELIAELVELDGNMASLVAGLPDDMMEGAGFRDP